MLESRVPMAAALLLSCGPAFGSDFATEVVDYDNTNSAQWNDPSVVLGRPAIDTDGDFSIFEDTVAVLPVYAPWTPEEIYRIGEGTSLTVRFDHPVVDDPLNPCGVDFIIFGNAWQEIGGDQWWLNEDPNATTVGTTNIRSAGHGIVSVSQTGEPGDWHTFADGPWADGFAPTLGRIYDPDHPDPSLESNFWWGEPTVPTHPLDPTLTPDDFKDHTVAQIAKKYGYSAGGTGFDLSQLAPPLGWIQYVRVEYAPAAGSSPEIDAFVDVAAVVLPDLDCDSDVDQDDVDISESCATGPEVQPSEPACKRADFDQDGDVDQDDFARLQRCMTGPDVLLDWDCMD